MSTSVRAIRKRTKLRGRIRPFWAMAESTRAMAKSFNAMADALQNLQHELTHALRPLRPSAAPMWGACGRTL